MKLQQLHSTAAVAEAHLRLMELQRREEIAEKTKMEINAVLITSGDMAEKSLTVNLQP